MKGWNPDPKEEKGKAPPGVGLSQRQGRGRRSINLIDESQIWREKKRGRIRVAFGIELSSGLVGTEFLGFRHHTSPLLLIYLVEVSRPCQQLAFSFRTQHLHKLCP